MGSVNVALDFVSEYFNLSNTLSFHIWPICRNSDCVCVQISKMASWIQLLLQKYEMCIFSNPSPPKNVKNLLC